MLGRKAAAIFVLGRAVRHGVAQSSEFHAYFTPLCLDGDDAAGKHVALLVAYAEADGGGFGKDELRDAVAVLGAREHGQQQAGPVLLHLHRDDVGVERAGGEGLFQYVAEDLSGHVIERGF